MKILISDYDQTFYLNDNDLNKNINSVNEFRKNGNLFVFATGRSYKDFMNKVHFYNLEYDYVILNHGTTILDRNNNVLSNYVFSDKFINVLKNDLYLDRATTYFCCNLENSRCNIEASNINKINIKYASIEEAKSIKNYLENKYGNYINIYLVMSGSLEIIPKTTDKLKAINFLINKLNINEVYTIGDGYSDIDMVKYYNGYCMKDSIDELKEFCKEKVVDSVSTLIEKIQ